MAFWKRTKKHPKPYEVNPMLEKPGEQREWVMVRLHTGMPGMSGELNIASPPILVPFVGKRDYCENAETMEWTCTGTGELVWISITTARGQVFWDTLSSPAYVRTYDSFRILAGECRFNPHAKGCR